MIDEIDVHTEHCCADHGCKYGDPKCPVVANTKMQSFPCEYCPELVGYLLYTDRYGHGTMPAKNIEYLGPTLLKGVKIIDTFYTRSVDNARKFYNQYMDQFMEGAK